MARQLALECNNNKNAKEEKNQTQMETEGNKKDLWKKKKAIVGFKATQVRKLSEKMGKVVDI